MVHTSYGTNCSIDEQTIVGYKYDIDVTPAAIGDNVTIRAGSTIYADVILHNDIQTGHNVLIREHTEIGAETIVGTNTVIDGYSNIGAKVSLQTGVYIPSNTQIEDSVFVGPHAVLTNDPAPVRQEVDLDGPTIRPSVSIGANATILPDVTIGKRSFIAAGSVVTKDVPPDTLAIGAPATFKPLPDELRGENNL